LYIVLDDNTLLPDLEHDVKIYEVYMSSVNATTREKCGFDAATLANNWGIWTEVANRTCLMTTQSGVKRMIHPSLTNWLNKNDLQLIYRCLPVTCFTDTIFSNTKSRVRNKAAQVFCTDDGWTRALPTKKENEAHEALSLLLHRDGGINVMVMDGSKAQVQGDFRQKLYDAGCHIKQTEPYTSKSNLGKGGVCELKRGVGY
jgi:hypothetical protein